MHVLAAVVAESERDAVGDEHTVVADRVGGAGRAGANTVHASDRSERCGDCVGLWIGRGR